MTGPIQLVGMLIPALAIIVQTRTASTTAARGNLIGPSQYECVSNGDYCIGTEDTLTTRVRPRGA